MESCRLCLQGVARLENSHYLPAGIYRRLRDDKGENPNPVLLTEKAAVQTSKQVTHPLLCRQCEERFCTSGERWVLTNCLQKDGGFPLASLLADRDPDIAADDSPTKLYYAAKIPEIDISALAYFAASVFWRGSIHRWNTDGTIPIDLGPFQERFRRYLMDFEPFPTDCSSLWVVVREGNEIDRLTYTPTGNRIGRFHSYRFPMPGLFFLLCVGKNISARFTGHCLVGGCGNPIIVTSVVERLLWDEGIRMRRRSLQTKRPANSATFALAQHESLGLPRHSSQQRAPRQPLQPV